MRLMKLMAVLAALAVGGCAGGGQTAVIPTRELPPVPTPQAQAQAPESTGGMADLATLRKPMENEFLAAEKAADCPMVEVSDPQGKREEIQLGRAGYVTVVVVWMMDTSQAKAAILHVNDLARKYASVGVRAVGIVEMTEMAKDATDFAGVQQLAMPLYFDDAKQSALRTLAGEVGASKKRAVPSIFIIDRHLRLRFYRPGFRWAMKAAAFGDQWRYTFTEEANENQTVEHYVQQILNESW